jgi:hypothetical protein
MPIDPTSPLRKAIDALRTQLDRAASEIASLEAQRENVATAPPAAADLHAAIDAWVDAQADRYKRPLHELLTAMIGAPLAVDGLMLDSARPWFGKVLSLAGQNERLDGPAVHHGAMCLVATDLVSAALKSEVDALLATQAQGLPLAERRARLAELDAKIAERRAALATLKAEAAAAGVSIA